MKKGFTLIELLIVVAIIAILAAIAVPNFLEAQTRAKVSRVKADMRTIATGLEAYVVDTNHYPWDCVQPSPAIDPNYYGTNINTQFGTTFHLNNMLTTPIAYLTTISFKDPFVTDVSSLTAAYLRYFNIQGTYEQSSIAARQQAWAGYYRVYGNWVLSSYGPNRATDTTPTGAQCEEIPGATASSLMYRYDPTNGTVSKGDVMRCQKTGDNPAYPASFPLPS